MIGDWIPEDDSHWLNFLRLIKITRLVISPISSSDTIDSLYVLIQEHNRNFKIIYPDVDFTPKLHFMGHLPNQIRKFGPGRNHWCTRFEAKHNLFKSKKWRNFRAIEKSVAIHHQRWMCLQQSTSGRKKSEVYLYQGDTVSEGVTVSENDLPCNVRHAATSSGTEVSSNVMTTNSVCIRGITYKINDVLLLSKDEPLFGIVHKIYVIEHKKFFEVIHLDVTDFNSHINSFECTKSGQKSTVWYNNMMYKWPQTAHYYEGMLHVMLYNVDFSWN